MPKRFETGGGGGVSLRHCESSRSQSKREKTFDAAVFICTARMFAEEGNERADGGGGQREREGSHLGMTYI